MSRSRLCVAAAAAAAALVAVSGCAPWSTTAGQPVRSAAAPKVTSSIREGAELTAPVRWRSRVLGVRAGVVVAVWFLIDGMLRYRERTAPYVFDGPGNWLLPGTLRRGTHVFAVDVTLAGGRHLTVASTGLMSAHAPDLPRRVLGRWIRSVTTADVARTRTLRHPADSAVLRAGTWTVRIGVGGIARYRRPGDQGELPAGQVRFEPGGLLAVGKEIPGYPGPPGCGRSAGPGFCAAPVRAGIYRWSLRGDALVVRLVSDRHCANRNSFWSATFTRLTPKLTGGEDEAPLSLS